MKLTGGAGDDGPGSDPCGCLGGWPRVAAGAQLLTCTPLLFASGGFAPEASAASTSADEDPSGVPAGGTSPKLGE